MKNFKKFALDIAESFDAWRIVPRIMLISYGYLVWHLYTWYKSIPVYTQMKCDGVVLQLLLDHKMSFIQAKDLACNIIGTVGGPTGEQTIFVTTIIGLSTGIFALYTTTGRKWMNESVIVQNVRHDSDQIEYSDTMSIHSSQERRKGR